jgi:ABC-2 type transport system ATP-binding protein
LVYRGKLIALDTPESLKRSVQSSDLPEPTMEDTFIQLIKRFDASNGQDNNNRR